MKLIQFDEGLDVAREKGKSQSLKCSEELKNEIAIFENIYGCG